MSQKLVFRGLGLFLLAGLLMSSAGCCSFNRDWKAQMKKAVPENEIEGPWDGSWLSETKGHHGRLRGLLTRQTEDQYRARFHAKFWKIFSFGYTVPLTATKTNEAYHMRGDADLGWWAGGAYHYEADANPTNFIATYRSKGDHGTFQMHRPRASD